MPQIESNGTEYFSVGSRVQVKPKESTVVDDFTNNNLQIESN